MPTTKDNSIVTKGILRYFYGKLDNNVNTLLSLKVDKEDGKGLSTNDFTNAYKNKLDGLSNYSLPIASGSKLGGIKTGYTTTGKTYGVKVDADGDAYVSVPWTDTNTTYGVVSKTANGLAPMLPNETGTTKFLRQDGTWVAPPNTTYGVVTTSANGLAPKLSNNAGQYLNGQGKWTTPSGYTLPTASSTVLGGVKIGSNISITSGTISIDKADVTGALGYTPPTTNTTYGLATTSANGLLKKLNGSTNSFMAGDGNWKDIISVIDSRISAKILTFFPVGTIIQTENSANPSTYLGGTWQAYAQGRTLIGAGTGNDGTRSMTFTALGEYGNYQHKLMIDELAKHKHNYAPSWVTQSPSNTGIFGMAGSGDNYTYGGGVEYVGENTPFDIIQPSVCVYIWKRVA